MTQLTTPVSPINALALRWRALGMLAVVFGRQISMFHKMGARGGAAPAAMLEAWLYRALVELSADIAALPRAPTCPDDQRELDYLKSLHMYLGVLALLISQLRRELEDWAAALGRFTRPLLAGPVALTPAPVMAIGYLDSS